jgi:hypothetical protein
MYQTLESRDTVSGGRKGRNYSSASLNNASIHSLNEDVPLISSQEKDSKSKDNFKSINFKDGWISSAKLLCAIAVFMILVASVIGLYAFQHNKHVGAHEEFPQGAKNFDFIGELTDVTDDNV